MPHRDPQTGKFVAGSSDSDIDRMEQLHASSTLSVAAADLDGGVGQAFGEQDTFEGVLLYDFEQALDRDEVGVIQWQAQHITVYGTSTSTADGTVRGSVEFSLSPDLSRGVQAVQATQPVDDQTGNSFTIDRSPEVRTVTGDVLGRHLTAVGFSPFSDGTSGVGGSGGAGTDAWEGPILVDPVVDDRDALFANGAIEVSNVSDAAVHVDIDVWTAMAVIEE